MALKISHSLTAVQLDSNIIFDIISLGHVKETRRIMK